MPVAQQRLEVQQVCKLLQSVRLRDKIQIEKLVLNGVPHLVNYNEPNDGETALNIAAATNDEDMIDFLLDLGAHPDVMDFKGRSAIMRAAEYGHTHSLAKLAKAGADMKVADFEGKGVLYYCLLTPSQRHRDCTEICLAAGAEVNKKSTLGRPVIVEACEKSDELEELCLTLLSKGADVSAVDSETRRTPLIASCKSGSEKVVHLILERGGEVNAASKNGTVAAHEASKGGFLNILFALAGFGARFDVVDQAGNTPVHYAAWGGHDMCVKFLSQRGSNPKLKNGDGFTARAIAKELKFKAAAKEARRAERTFGKVTRNNEPWAIRLYDFCQTHMDELVQAFTKADTDQSGRITKEDFIDTLVNLGASLDELAIKTLVVTYDPPREGLIDFKDFLTAKKYFNKKYMQAAFLPKKKKKKGNKGRKVKLKILMPICTAPEGPRTEGGGPPEIFIPKHIHYTDVERFNRDKPPTQPLADDSAWYLQVPSKTFVNVCDAARNGDMDSLKLALRHGYSLDIRDRFFKTPLMIACGVANIEVVKFLLEHGSEIEAVDNFKWTALHHACHTGILDVVKLLVESGADINAVSLNGSTPFTRAIENSKLDIVNYLMELPNLKMRTENKKGFNPIEIAVQFADPRVYDSVRVKWDSLPEPKQGKKGKKRKTASPKKKVPVVDGKGGGNAEVTTTEQVVARPRLSEGIIEKEEEAERRGSILRAASAIAAGLDEEASIVFTPRKTWTKQPTTQEIVEGRHVRSDRFGWEVDFPEFEMPFDKNVSERVRALVAQGEDPPEP